jgi:hypothetical protein
MVYQDGYDCAGILCEPNEVAESVSGENTRVENFRWSLSC